MKQKNKINKKRLISIIGLISIIFVVISFAYYTNINKFLDEQQNVYVDGECQERLAEDFINNGCGTDTILDTVTGICWAKNLNQGSGTKKWAINNTYPEPIWTGTEYNWGSQSDTDYPAFKICNDLTTGGHSDWRMPTRAELLTLINESGSSGSTCSSLTNFGFTNCQNSYYWSSNQRGSYTTYAFNVHFDFGYSYSVGKTYSNYVACVRKD